MKSITILLLLTLLLPLTSSLEIDNWKTHKIDDTTSRYGTIDITNAFGLGSKIATYELLHNTDVCLNDCFAEGRATLYSSGSLFTSLNFYDDKRNIKSLNAPQMYLVYDDTIAVNVPHYERVCSLNVKNLSEDCRYVNDYNTTKNEIQRRLETYKGEILPAGDYTWRIEAKKGLKDNVDWISTSFGRDLTEWAWWNNSLNLKRELNFTTGDAIGINYTHRVRIPWQSEFGSTCNQVALVWQDAWERDMDIRICNSSLMEIGFRNNVSIGSNVFDNNYSLYYGAVITRKSDNNLVYVWNDDFTGSSVNTSKYDTIGTPNCDTVSGGICTMGSASGGQRGGLVGNINFTSPATFEINATYVVTNQQYGGFIPNLNIPDGATPYQVIGGNANLRLSANGVNNATAPFGSGTYKQYTLFRNGSTDIRGWQDNSSAFTNPTNILTYTTTSSLRVGFNFADSGGHLINYMRAFEDVNVKPAYTLSPQITLQIAVALNSPADNANISSNPVNFNVTITAGDSNIINNATLFIWNKTSNTIISKTTNTVTGITSNQTLFSISLNDDDYLWNVFGCDTAGAYCDFATGNRTVNVDTTPPLITISYPTHPVPYQIRSANLQFNWTVIDGITGTQFCNYQYAGVNTTVACQSNTTTINTTSSANRQIIFYANDTAGNQASLVRNWNYSIFEQNRTFAINTTELSAETFTINVTYDSNAYSSLSSTLVYNNTLYSATQTGSSNNIIASRLIDIPLINGSTVFKTFYWNFLLSNSTGSTSINTSTSQQQVNNLSLDDCGTYTNVILNYTFYDEDSRNRLLSPTANNTLALQAFLGNPSFTNYVSVNFNKSNTNQVRVCVQNALGTNYRLDAIAQYGSTDRVLEYHNIQNQTINGTTGYQNISLFDLLTTQSQEFLITFKDSNLIPVPDALIEINRQYLSIGQFLPVEIPKTDTDGRTIGHFVLSDAIYTINVKKNGQLLATYNNVRAFCTNQATGDCKINLNQDTSSTRPSSFINYLGVAYIPSYNATSRIYSLIYTSLDGTAKTVALNVSTFSPSSNQSICATSITASGGTLTCPIPSSFGNQTGVAKYTVNGALLGQDIFSLKGGNNGQIGNFKFFFAFLLLVTLPFLFITSGAMVLISFIVGMLLASMMLLVDFGGIVGTGSAILWFLVAAGILLWKLSRGGNR